jgi:ribose transport system substrate-binding protein
VIEQYPGVQILAKPLAADWNREKGVKATETYMSRFGPGEMDFVWAASNEMGLGAIQALGKRDRLNDAGGEEKAAANAVSVFTNDVTPESTDAIRQGKLIAETHHGFPEWGWFGTEVAAKLACKEDVEQTIDIRPRTVYQGNADKFYPQPELPPIDWDAIKQGCE